MKKRLPSLFIYYFAFVFFALILLPCIIILFSPENLAQTAHIERESVKYLPVAAKNEDQSLPVAVKNNEQSLPLITNDLLVKTVLVYRHEYGVTEEIDFEKYVKGVVASEMPAHFELEALKAQAVAARTYSLSKIIRSGDGGNPLHPSAPVCDDTHCQVYRSEQDLLNINGQGWMQTGWPKINEAVESTEGKLMYYDGELIASAMFHSTSGGKTANSEDVFVSALPYLRSVESPLEDGSPHKNRYGHGVGMSQWGANGMATAGDDYKKILSHYYTGIEIR